MRNKTERRRDSYILDLIKQASLFTIMAAGLKDSVVREDVGLFFIAILAVIFMFIPRVIINDVLDRESTSGDNEPKAAPRVLPEWKRKLTVILQLIKFGCLVILTLYMVFNETMLAIFGPLPWFLAAAFMIIPRKLIYMFWASHQTCEEA